jgi:hypothetical protein
MKNYELIKSLIAVLENYRITAECSEAEGYPAQAKFNKDEKIILNIIKGLKK